MLLKIPDLIVIAVKPYNIIEVLEEIRDYLNPEKHILISVTAGTTLSQIQDVIGISMPVFRAMPKYLQVWEDQFHAFVITVKEKRMSNL